MKKKRFPMPKAGEWVQPTPRGYLMACCDCGLVHRMDFRIAKGKRNGKQVERAQFRVFRARNHTARMRKRMVTNNGAKL